MAGEEAVQRRDRKVFKKGHFDVFSTPRTSFETLKDVRVAGCRHGHKKPSPACSRMRAARYARSALPPTRQPAGPLPAPPSTGAASHCAIRSRHGARQGKVDDQHHGRDNRYNQSCTGNPGPARTRCAAVLDYDPVWGGKQSRRGLETPRRSAQVIGVADAPLSYFCRVGRT